MKRLISAIAAAAFAAAAFAGAALAAKDEAIKFRPDQFKKGDADTPALLTELKLTCQSPKAVWRGTGEEKVDGKSVKQEAYEVACANGPGFMLIKPVGQAARSLSCVRLRVAYEQAIAAKKTSVKCELPENQNLIAQLQPAISKGPSKCTVTNYAFLGYSPQANLDRYELACQEGMGYVVDVAADVASVTTMDPCYVIDTTKQAECKLTPKTAIDAYVAGLAKPLDASCQLTNQRWVGRSQESGHDFFELACSGKAGYFLEVDKGAAVKKIDCVRAALIGGGCTFTDTASAAKDASTGYGGALASHDVTCSIAKVQLIGTDNSGREVVEFTCPEKPYGLVMFNPRDGKGKFQAVDCFKLNIGADCRLTDKAGLLAKWTSNLAAAGQTCQATAWRYIGAEEDETETFEVKCSAGQPGLVATMTPDRTKVVRAKTCAKAESYEKCTLPGNA